MQLDDDDRQALARACARRFPRAEDQARLSRAAGIPGEFTSPDDASAAWEHLLRLAETQGRLPKLAAELARAAPGDETFTALARTLGALAAPDRKGPPLAALAGGFGALLLVGGLGVWAMGGGGSAAAPARPAASAAPAPSAVAAVEPVPVPTEVANSEPTPKPAEVSPAPEAAMPPPEPAKPAPEPARPAPVAAPARALGTLPVGCVGAPAGEVVGYWYAGTSKPGEQGATITLDRDARVRSDYPRRENKHNAALPERCVLPRGTQQVLVQPPIDASSGHWWVPLVAP